MSLVDFILNIVGLALWLNWRAVSLPLTGTPGKSLVLTLRPAGPPRPRLYYGFALALLLLARAAFYWQVGDPIHWSPRIPLGPTTLAFRSDLLGRMFLFSVLSFAVTLGLFYLGLLLLSAVNSPVTDADPGQRVVRAYLGKLDRWPWVFKLFLPLAVTALAWCLLNPLLTQLNMVPADSWRHLVGQGAVIGLAVYLPLKFLLVAFLFLHLLNTYVYLGEFTLWNFINATARRLLWPLHWLPLQVGKIDFVPILSIILIVVAAEFAQRGLLQLYQKLI
jgi:uncharacterized protein YggT (Ycf19 family)